MIKPIPYRVMAIGMLMWGLASQAQAYNADDWNTPQQVYSKICSHCHETGIGPQIRGRDLSPDYIRHVVRHGKQAMPAFRPSDIGPQTLEDLAQLIGRGSPLAKR